MLLLETEVLYTVNLNRVIITLGRFFLFFFVSFFLGRKRKKKTKKQKKKIRFDAARITRLRTQDKLCLYLTAYFFTFYCIALSIILKRL